MISTAVASTLCGEEPRQLQNATDEELMRMFQNGDESAFDVLFRRYRDRAIAYAWRMLKRREEAEEVALEAFARVVNGAWRPTGSFRGFLFSVIHRLCIDHLRKRQRVIRLLPKATAVLEAPASPESEAIGVQRVKLLDDALDQLSDEHRAVVLLYYRQELPSKECADILGCSDQQVRSRLSYARRKLKELLGGALGANGGQE